MYVIWIFGDNIYLQFGGRTCNNPTTVDVIIIYSAKLIFDLYTVEISGYSLNHLDLRCTHVTPFSFSLILLSSRGLDKLLICHLNFKGTIFPNLFCQCFFISMQCPKNINDEQLFNVLSQRNMKLLRFYDVSRDFLYNHYSGEPLK